MDKLTYQLKCISPNVTKLNFIGRLDEFEEVHFYEDCKYQKLCLHDVDNNRIYTTLYFKADNLDPYIVKDNVFIIYGLAYRTFNSRFYGKGNIHNPKVFKALVFQRDSTDKIPINLGTRKPEPNFNMNGQLSDTIDILFNYSNNHDFKRRRLDSSSDNNNNNFNNNNSKFTNKSVQQHTFNTIHELTTDCKPNTLVNVVAKIMEVKVFPSATRLNLWDGTGDCINWDPINRKVGVLDMIGLNCWNDSADIIKNLEIDQWVSFTKLRLSNYNNTMELKVLKSTVATVLPESDPIVISIVKKCDERVKNILNKKEFDNNDELTSSGESRSKILYDEYQEESDYSGKSLSGHHYNTTNKELTKIDLRCFGIEEDFSDREPFTIQQVLDYDDAHVFNLRVVLKQFIPYPYRKWINFQCDECKKFSSCLNSQLLCPYCSSININCFYLIKLIVSDSTGDMDVLLTRKDALYFFNQIDNDTNQKLLNGNKDAFLKLSELEGKEFNILIKKEPSQIRNSYQNRHFIFGTRCTFDQK